MFLRLFGHEREFKWFVSLLGRWRDQSGLLKRSLEWTVDGVFRVSDSGTVYFYISLARVIKDRHKAYGKVLWSSMFQ